MEDIDPGFASTALDIERLIGVICMRFEEAWRAGGSPHLEDFVAEVPQADQEALRRKLFGVELDYRLARGDRPSVADYEGRFLGYEETIRQEIERRLPVLPDSSHPPESESIQPT